MQEEVGEGGLTVFGEGGVGWREDCQGGGRGGGGGG